jgi:hypothetical protein
MCGDIAVLVIPMPPGEGDPVDDARAVLGPTCRVVPDCQHRNWRVKVAADMIPMWPHCWHATLISTVLPKN